MVSKLIPLKSHKDSASSNGSRIRKNNMRKHKTILAVTFGLILIGTYSPSPLIKAAQADTVTAGCWHVQKLQKRWGKVRYRVEYGCYYKTRAKFDWARASDAPCLDWYKGSFMYTSRSKTRITGDPYYKKMASC